MWPQVIPSGAAMFVKVDGGHLPLGQAAMRDRTARGLAIDRRAGNPRVAGQAQASPLPQYLQLKVTRV